MRAIQIAVLLLVLAPLAAQDDRVHPYMQAVNDQFRLDRGYKIHMDYVREDIMRESRTEGEGTIWIKGLKYKIIVDEYIVYYDGEKLYSQNTEALEVYVSTPDPDEPGYLQAVPLKAIKSYQQDFKYQYMGETPFMGKQYMEIQLYPMNVGGPYSMLKLYIHPNTMKLKAFLLKHKEGIHYTMVLSEVTEDRTLTDDMFRFRQEDYPDTEVIELLE